METVTCIKTTTTKHGVDFKKGNRYEFAIHHDGIMIYLNKFQFVKVKSMDVFQIFFK